MIFFVGSVTRPKIDGSSFSGLFTRVEIGHMVIGLVWLPTFQLAAQRNNPGQEPSADQKLNE
jgi:hypothetical protein